MFIYTTVQKMRTLQFNFALLTHGSPPYSIYFYFILLYIRMKEFCNCSLVEKPLEKGENQSQFSHFTS